MRSNRSTSSSRLLPGHSKNQKGESQKSASFNGRVRKAFVATRHISVPETRSELASSRRTGVGLPEGGGDSGSNQKLTKLHVTVPRSIVPVNVIVSPETTIEDLIKATLEVARKESRPLLRSMDSQDYTLHCSQFSLESLNSKERLMDLSWRNFFLCPKQSAVKNSSSCANEAEEAQINRASSFQLLEIMDFLL